MSGAAATAVEFAVKDSTHSYSSHSEKRYDNIQYMRGIAALLVVIAHCVGGAASPLGPIGVSIFFVISGFIMTVNSWDSFGKPGAQADFIRRRLQRIFPLYWITLTVKCLIDTRHKDILWIVGSYLLLPVPAPDGLVEPIHGVGWSLVWEMIFYYIFTASLFLSRSYGICLNLFVLAGLAVTGYIFPDFRLNAWHGSSIFTLFMCGILVGAVSRYVRRNNIISAILALISISSFAAIFLFHLDQIRFEILDLIMAASTVGASVLASNIAPYNLISRFAHLLGDASYSLYLVHTLTLSLLRFAFKAAHLSQDGFIFMFLSLPITIVSGLVIYSLIEKPIVHAFKRTRSRQT